MVKGMLYWRQGVVLFSRVFRQDRTGQIDHLVRY